MQSNSTDLQLASMRSRAYAYIVDDLLLTVIVIAIFWGNISSLSDNMEAMMFFILTDLVMPFIVLR